MNDVALQVRLGNLPVVALFFLNRDVVFAPIAQFKTIFDQKPEGVNATFYTDLFTLDDEPMKYHMRYNLDVCTKLKNWLIQQNLNPYAQEMNLQGFGNF